MSETQNIQKIATAEFLEWITTLKTKIRSARNKLAFTINSQVLELYWEIGRDITEKQQYSDWGSGFIEQIATELRHEFPDITGFSRRNVYVILQWYKFYSTKYQFVPHHVAQIPWGHNRIILNKIKDIDEAEFYCCATAYNAWDRDTLEIQIKTKIDVEYALRDIHKPMGISEYILTNSIPEDIKPQLPSVEELEHELEKKQNKTDYDKP